MKVIRFIKEKIRFCIALVRRRCQTDIWEYCHKEQYRIWRQNMECSNEPLSEFEQGMVVAYRKVQYELRKKCSEFGNDA